MTFQVRSALVAASTSTGNQDITVAGWTETPVFARLAWGWGTTSGVRTNGTQTAVGMAGGGSQVCSGARTRHNVGTSGCRRYRYEDRILNSIGATTDTIVANASFVSFISGGIRINWVTASGSARLIQATFWAGTDILDVAVGQFLNNQAQDAELSLNVGFQPTVGLFAATGSASGNVTSGSSNLSLGFFNDNGGAIQQAMNCNFGDDASTTMVQTNRYRDTRIAMLANDTTGGLAVSADIEVTTIESTGLGMTKRTGGSNVGVHYGLMRLSPSIGHAMAFGVVPGSAGADPLTGLAFRPQAAVFLGGRQTNTSAQRDKAALYLGVATGDPSAEASVIDSFSKDQIGTAVENTATLSGSVMYALNNTEVEALSGRLTAFTADGYSLTWDTVTADGIGALYSVLLFEEEASVDPDAQGRTTWAELEVPDLADAQGRTTWAELEVPDLADARGRTTWAELEVPDLADARGRTTWAEFETPDQPADARGRTTWAELEAPNPPSTPDAQGRTTWMELETPDQPGDARGRTTWVEFRTPNDPLSVGIPNRVKRRLREDD